MGRPKALKQKDQNAKNLKIDATIQNNKKITHFDEDAAEEIVTKDETSLNDNLQDKDINEKEDDSPEEIQAESLEILQLKKQLEDTIMVQKLTRAKRKRTAQVPLPALDNDGLLDVNLFQNSSHPEEEEAEKDVSKPLVISAPANAQNTHVRNFGMLEVQLLESEERNPVKKFKASREVTEFAKLRSSNLRRTKYGSFITQRRATPSRSFVVNTKA